MFYLFQLTSQWSLVPLFPLLKADAFLMPAGLEHITTVMLRWQIYVNH